MSQNLSKTDYLLYRECPKNVWYKINKPKLFYSGELSAFEEAIIETGNEVELIARQLFPTGILIEGRDEQAEMVTQGHIANKEATLFQPVFVKDGFFAALDILKYHPEKNSYSIYEIKATNDIDDKSHYHDLAFQVNLLMKFGYKIESIFLLHLNSEYVRSEDVDIIKLFTIDNVTTEVVTILDSVAEEMHAALDYISVPSEPNGYCSCIYKGRSKHCSTFRHSNKEVPEYSVHDLARIGNSKNKLMEMIDGNIFNLHDIPESIELSDIQRNQIDAHVLDRVLMHKDKIDEELDELVFPLYFVDYETFPCAIPRFDGFSPYQQIPFQYSLFILESEGIEPRHVEFLHEGKDDPSPHFARHLVDNIGEKGSIIVWNKKFECKINEELGQRIPAFKSAMEMINSRVYDLMDIFNKQYFVHKGFRGKTSIKSVLPVLVPELSYKKLGIQEGGTASQSWNKLTTVDITEEESDRISRDLKEYCKLDTYAMYKIWRKLVTL
jgi:hypothetical protein